MISQNKTRTGLANRAGLYHITEQPKHTKIIEENQSTWCGLWVDKLNIEALCVADLVFEPEYQQVAKRAVGHLITVLQDLAERQGGAA